MRVPLEWLKQYVRVEATAEEIATRLTMGGLEVEGIEESALGPVLDVYITPNRGDCLSMVGVAREVAALYDLPLNTPTPPKSEPGGATVQQTSVTIDAPDLCPRYVARLVRGVKVGPSPDWMQARLEAAGQRPINNVVDVTNYVMLELGQPLHAFDFDKLAGGRIVVRRANGGETMQTLDGEERTLTAETLVIADAEKAVAVAGVMGGATSEVSDTTTNLLFESAHFNALSVRRASRALGLRTEASYRFERVVDPVICRRAADRACELLQQMGQPEAVAGVVDAMPAPIRGRDITLRVSRAAERLGMEITPEVAADCLRRLEIGFEAQGDRLMAHIPPRRSDLTIEEDLIEEVGRIYGYENIPETLPIGDTTQGGDSAEGRFIARLKQLFVGAGLQEVITHSLTAPSFFDSAADAERRVDVRNALSSEIGGLRHTLTPTLLDVAQHNATRGAQAMGLFEVGRVWHNVHNEAGELAARERVHVAGLLTGPLTEAGWQPESKAAPADFYTARGIVEKTLHGLGIEATFAPLGEQAERLPQYHPGRSALLYFGGERPCGIVGEVHPGRAANLDLRNRVYVFEISLEALLSAAPQQGRRYLPISRYPAVSRDIAPRVPQALSYAQVTEAVESVDLPILEELRLADVYTGPGLPEGMKSLTLALTFRSPSGTLQEAEITEALKQIRARLETQCAATFPA